MEPSGCPGPRFCSPRAETEGFEIQRQETSIPYTHIHTQVSKHAYNTDRVHYRGGVHLIKFLEVKEKGPEVIYKLT